MSTIKEKVENAGQAVGDAAKKIKEGGEVVADKAADAALSVGQAVKNAGQKLKDKSGA